MAFRRDRLAPGLGQALTRFSQAGGGISAARPAGLACSKYSVAVYYSKRSPAVVRYSTSDLSRKSGDIIAEAMRHPVTITQRNKPRLVLLSIEDYRRLASRNDARTVGTLATMSDRDFDAFRRAVEAYAAEREDL
jgi:prevent-host-death family protein